MVSLGNFSQCLVESDQESLKRARRFRRRALVISLFLEAGLLATMLVWPLITPGVLPRQFNVTPTPPFRGGGTSGPRQPHEPMHPPLNTGLHPPPCLICELPVISAHRLDGADPEPPSVDTERGTWCGNGSGFPGSGPMLPGGLDSGRQRNISHLPDQPQPRSPLSESAGVMEAMLVHRVQPEYTPLARAARISGTVQLRAIISRDGTVRELQEVSGNPLLVQAARAAVLQWRYRPTLLNGEPVEVETYITANFVLEQL